MALISGSGFVEKKNMHLSWDQVFGKVTKKHEHYVKYYGFINRYERYAQINRYNRAILMVG